jgi:hypothetical protein
MLRGALGGIQYRNTACKFYQLPQFLVKNCKYRVPQIYNIVIPQIPISKNKLIPPYRKSQCPPLCWSLFIIFHDLNLSNSEIKIWISTENIQENFLPFLSFLLASELSSAMSLILFRRAIANCINKVSICKKFQHKPFLKHLLCKFDK